MLVPGLKDEKYHLKKKAVENSYKSYTGKTQ